MKDFEIPITYDENLINTLAERQYPHKARQTVKEFIANSLDANASHIWITTDNRNRTIQFRDNGEGLDRKKLENDFGCIGTVDKQENPTRDDGRQKIGQFGIGRVIGFLLGDFDIRTKTESGFCANIEYNREEKKLIGMEGLSLSSVGTIVTIKNIDAEIWKTFTEAKIIEYVQSDLAPEEILKVSINSKKVSGKKYRGKKYKMDFTCYGTKYFGEIYWSDEKLSTKESGVDVYVVGQFIHKNSFGVLGIYADHINGYVMADGLKNYVLSSRFGFDESHPYYKSFEKTVRGFIGDIVTKHKLKEARKRTKLETIVAKKIIDALRNLWKKFPELQVMDAARTSIGHKNKIDDELTNGDVQREKGEKEEETNRKQEEPEKEKPIPHPTTENPKPRKEKRHKGPGLHIIWRDLGDIHRSYSFLPGEDFTINTGFRPRKILYDMNTISQETKAKIIWDFDAGVISKFLGEYHGTDTESTLKLIDKVHSELLG